MADANVGKPMVKLNQNLVNLEVVTQDVLDYIVLGTFDIHLEQGDPLMAEILHQSGDAFTGDGDREWRAAGAE